MFLDCGHVSVYYVFRELKLLIDWRVIGREMKL